jgi:hypothetical protein
MENKLNKYLVQNINIIHNGKKYPPQSFIEFNKEQANRLEKYLILIQEIKSEELKSEELKSEELKSEELKSIIKQEKEKVESKIMFIQDIDTPKKKYKINKGDE